MKRIISVIGNGYADLNSIEYKTAYQIGKLLIDNGYRLLTGGLGGVMEGASKGAGDSKKHTDGDIIGILPGLKTSDANPFIDIPIPTGLGISRNVICANSDGIIAIGGGCGTLSEIAMAWQMNRLILAYRKSNMWSRKIADTKVDDRYRYPAYYDDKVFGFNTPEEAIAMLNEKIDIYNINR